MTSPEDRKAALDREAREDWADPPFTSEMAHSLAKHLYDTSDNRAMVPAWENLGEVTKGVWLGYALAELTTGRKLRCA